MNCKSSRKNNVQAKDLSADIRADGKLNKSVGRGLLPYQLVLGLLAGISKTHKISNGQRSHRGSFWPFENERSRAWTQWDL
jgi:hypothetical protein